jgi:septum formation protein
MADAPLILASGSSARRDMLTNAGVHFSVLPARVNEAGLKAALAQKMPCALPADLALALADAKALDVSACHLKTWVVGSDQVLALGETMFSKAASRAEAADVLRSLRGKTHEIHSAVSLARGGAIVWRDAATAKMGMRNFSDSWLEHYLDSAQDAVRFCVGCYQLEGLGVQLFDKIDGDYFTVLGMPLLSLLRALRTHGVIET